MDVVTSHGVLKINAGGPRFMLNLYLLNPTEPQPITMVWFSCAHLEKSPPPSKKTERPGLSPILMEVKKTKRRKQRRISKRWGTKKCLRCVDWLSLCPSPWQRASSKAASHNDDVFGEAVHFGHFKTSQLTVEFHHSFISLTNFTKSTMRTWKWEKKR